MAGGQHETNPDDMLARRLAGQMADAFLKGRLRREMRRMIAANAGKGDTAAVVGEISKFLTERPGMMVVAVFAAIAGEVDLRSLPVGIARTWVFPRIVRGELHLYEVIDFGSDLEEGAYGIMEPKSDLPELDIGDVDVFLCPGLAFDPKGGRIGRGKGFYDRMLGKSRPDALKVGVCFGYQLVNDIVMEEHDVRMNAVIAG